MNMRRSLCAAAALVLITFVSLRVIAQSVVGYERLLNSAKEPHNWLMYGGDYFSSRYSLLSQITPANVKSLSLAWVYQSPVAGSWQPTPLVVDGIMYLTQRPNDVIALDAMTGRVFWIYRHQNAADLVVCCGSNNRGVAMLGDMLFMGTLDAHRDCARRQKRASGLEDESRGKQRRVFHHRRAAGAQGSRHHRDRRWRIRDSRVHRGVRSAHGKRDVALLQRSGSRESRATRHGKPVRQTRRPIAILKRGNMGAHRSGSPDRTTRS